MNGRFSGQVVLVTGVNDRGIGGAIVERFASEGAALAVLWYVRPNRTINRLARKDSPFVECFCDVTQQDSVDSAIQTVLQRFGKLDTIVNNAGVDHPGDLEGMSDTTWNEVLDVNLSGSMRVIRSALPHLTENGGVIVNLASVLGIAGCSGFSAYSATKAGIIGLTQSLAMELAPRGIRAVCVAPALVQTPMTQKYAQNITSTTEREIKQTHPLGIGTPQDVASAVAFVASSEARWITGITLPLGWTSSFPLPQQQFVTNETRESDPVSLKIPEWLQIRDDQRHPRRSTG